MAHLSRATIFAATFLSTIFAADTCTATQFSDFLCSPLRITKQGEALARNSVMAGLLRKTLPQGKPAWQCNAVEMEGDTMYGYAECDRELEDCRGCLSEAVDYFTHNCDSSTGGRVTVNEGQCFMRFDASKFWSTDGDGYCNHMACRLCN